MRLGWTGRENGVGLAGEEEIGQGFGWGDRKINGDGPELTHPRESGIFEATGFDRAQGEG